MPVRGMGEVGQAVAECLGITLDALHICFPWSSHFVEEVIGYQSGNQLTIIHSTVPVGTTAKIPHAVHSPIRGTHPNLVDGIRSFCAYIGGPRAAEAVPILKHMGAPTVITTPKSETTEALKLWDTTQYGLSIVIQKSIKRYCDIHNLDYGLVYEHANYSYNLGYSTLGRSNVVRPVLQHVPGPIGGHCIMPNCGMLDDEIADFIRECDGKIPRE